MDDDTVTEDDLLRFDTPEEALQYLRISGTVPDDEINLAECALALALVFLPGLSVDRYRQHIKKMITQVHDEYQSRLRLGEEDTLKLRASILHKIIHEAHGYEGDAKTYEDLQNASFIRMIERRKGLPITLGILYIILARAQDWDFDGLTFPGHFLVRMELGGQRLILDPFHKGKGMSAADLRQLLKAVVGQRAELAHNYYTPATNRGMLVRLQNNLKNRLIEQEDYAQALSVLDTMEAIAPDEYRVLFDKAVLYMKLNQTPQAIRALERYIDKCPILHDRQQAAALLQQIQAE